MSTPTSVWPSLAMRSAQKIGSSVIEPCGRAKVHSPSQSSVPVMLIAGTWKRSSIASLVGTQLSVIAGPKTTRQPSSTSSPYASITALIVPLGRPSTSRKTISTGRSISPCSSPSPKTSSNGRVRSLRISCG